MWSITYFEYYLKKLKQNDTTEKKMCELQGKRDTISNLVLKNTDTETEFTFLLLSILSFNDAISLSMLKLLLEKKFHAFFVTQFQKGRSYFDHLLLTVTTCKNKNKT